MRPRLARWLRGLPLWLRWLITILAYAALIVGVVAVVRSGGGSETGDSGGSAQEEAAAAAQADREGRIAIAEDEAPHTAPLRRGTSIQAALERAIATDVHARIAGGQLTGPLQSVRCQAPGAPRTDRRELSCTVHSAGLSYPFVAVADKRAHELTWCKVDPPPEAGAPLEVPVSSRCRTVGGRSAPPTATRSGG